MGNKKNKLIMFVVILMTFICGISTFTTTVNAASGGYAIKPGGESNDM
ncbi:hypothetical protein [Companilactobacillus farciminis]|nr:hypothetical protein [Companilactobacillus farciminis]